MSQPHSPPFPDFSAFSGEAYAQWEKSMRTWWDTVLEDDQFLAASGKGLAGAARGRRMYEDAVDQGMAQMHLPSRSDLVRLTRVATLLEEKLLQVEDQLLELQDALGEAQRDALQARVEAAEGRLEQRAAIERLEAKLAALQAQA